MSQEYKDRGMIHKIYNAHTPKRKLLRAAAKLTLAAETTAIFAKDAATNRLVAKEFHIKLERKQSNNGKFRTHINLVRADAEIKKPVKGVLHGFHSLAGRLEGDVPNSPLTAASAKLKKLQPKTKRGKLVKKFAQLGVFTASTSVDFAKKTALAYESVAVKTGGTVYNLIKQNLTKDMKVSDTGRAYLAAISTLKAINKGRKTLIVHHKQRLKYKSLKLKFKGIDQKGIRNKFLKQKKTFTAYKKQQKVRLKNFRKIRAGRTEHQKQTKLSKAAVKGKIAYQKKAYKTDRKIYKNQKKNRRLLKKEMKKTKPATLGGMGIASGTKKIIASSRKALIAADGNNDITQALEASRRVVKVSAATAQKGAKVLRNGTGLSLGKRQQRTHTKTNKLQVEKSKLAKNKRSVTKRKQMSKASLSKKAQFSAQDAKKSAEKAAKAATHAVMDFAKFAVKALGIMLMPILGILMAICIVFVMISGGSGNSSWIFGTYNAKDRYLSKATEEYTKIAYEFNQHIIDCGDTNEWKNALSDLGIDTADFETTPTSFTLGKSSKFNYAIADFDFDADMLSAFMCSYTYIFYDDEDEEMGLWEWSDEYIDILQELFDEEYAFQCYYEDLSGWTELSSYTFYGGGSAGDDGSSYCRIDGNTLSRDDGIVCFRYITIPKAIQVFADSDQYIYYDEETCEILDANNDYERTGYFLQNQLESIKDSSGNANSPFYSLFHYLDSDGYHTYYGFYSYDDDGQLVSNSRTARIWNGTGEEIYCVVSATDTLIWHSDFDEGTCLVSYYLKNEWVDECNLYYTVRQKCTFAEAIVSILSDMEDGENRVELFYAFVNGTSSDGDDEEAETVPTYGLHQMLLSPVASDFQALIDDGKILNYYGYDIQTWGEQHCGALTECHTGIDIVANAKASVYAMMDGIVETVDEENGLIVLKTEEDLNFWYHSVDDDGDELAVRITYVNVTATVSEGDTVEAGDKIGTVTTSKQCYDGIDNSDVSKTYLHITIEINYGWWEEGIFTDGYITVDPRYLILRENEG